MDELRETIGKNIRIFRKQKGYTLRSLGEKIGISYQQLSRIEHGGGTSTVTLERIASVLDIKVSDLTEDSEQVLQKNKHITRNFVSDGVCDSMYTTLFNNIIKPVNDAVANRIKDDIINLLLKKQEEWIVFCMNLCTECKETDKDKFTPEEVAECSRSVLNQFICGIFSLIDVDLSEKETDDLDYDTYYEE